MEFTVQVKYGWVELRSYFVRRGETLEGWWKKIEYDATGRKVSEVDKPTGIVLEWV